MHNRNFSNSVHSIQIVAFRQMSTNIPIKKKKKLNFQSISEFLKNLPCHNEQNFSLFNTENGIRTSSRRPSVYLPTVDIPSEQSMYCVCVIGQRKYANSCYLFTFTHAF